ncbi:hypothetical protein [Neisseria iguanae]|nr:hypothetical protein [Neisseria iguanae]
MNQIIYQNPAKRLLLILQNGQKITTQKNCLTVWREILEAEDDIGALIKLGKVASLPDEIESFLNTYAPDLIDDGFYHWSRTIKTALIRQNLNEMWGIFLNRIDVHSINYLKMTANIIEIYNSGKKPLDKEQTDDLIEKSNGLIELIKQEPSLNENSKLHLTKYLNKLIEALHEYHITGNQEIFYILEGLMGHSFIDEDYAKILNGQSENSLGKKIADFISFTANLISVTAGVPILAEAIKTLLEEK